jgi:ATP-binding cassette subfamily B protein
MNYSRQFTRPINDLANQFNMIQSAIAGAERVFEIMDTGTEYDDGRQSAIDKPIHGEVRFDNVTFSYKEGVPVLKNVTLTAKPGDTIALVGPTGAGKTTIVNLLTRFYDIDQGTVTIDGDDLREWDKNRLRGQLGIVLQDAYLFSDTIRENIRYGRLDATDEQIEAAARLANADTFIRKLPSGYDTLLSAEGGNLSQGQRQLITIARAILADPAILILDEATSSVDTRTEMHIQEAMKSLMQGRTSFVIAHRLSTIREADQILVINGGEIIEHGTHHELLERRGFYYELYTSQFKRVG